MAAPIKNVVIVGGGTAGWMTAASLIKYAQDKDMTITLIESSDIGTIGVGEATIPNIVEFNHNIGLDEVEFIKATQASFKLGIQFEDWHKKGESFFHPFADYGLQVNNVDFHHYVNKLRSQGQNQQLADYSFACVLAKSGNFAQPQPNPPSPLADYSYAYHFDATLYAAHLKQHAIKQGVNHIDGLIESVNTNQENGFIESVVLKNGDTISGELFVDCSGFKGLLIEETLQTGYEDWGHWLLCDRAVAVQTQSVSDSITPYTRSIARENGWQWNIPLQYRTGNGYIYSSSYESDDSAKQRLLDNVEGELITEPRMFKFHPGRRKQIWNKNCIAVGLSSGFLEPLESTSISLVQSAIAKLLTFFPDTSFNPHDIAEVNRLHNSELEHIRDFLILHYQLSKRDDSDFWRDCRNMDIPETLAHKINVFKSRGHIISRENESFEEASWLTMYNAFDVQPSRYDPRVDAMPVKMVEENLAKMKANLASAASQALDHRTFINKHCKADKI